VPPTSALIAGPSAAWTGACHSAQDTAAAIAVRIVRFNI
jgi:hypothetical protein